MTNTTESPSFLPSDQDIARQIIGEADDVLGTPSVNGATGSVGIAARINALPVGLHTLSPDDQEVVTKRMNALPMERRAGALDGLVRERIAELAYNARLRQGAGSGSSELVRVQAEIAHEVRELDAECSRIEERLASVAYHDGNGVPVLHHPVGSYVRLQLETDLNMKRGRANDLREGEGGQRRLTQAVAKSVEDRKAHLTSIYIQTESTRRAEAQVIEDRIAQAAASKARLLKGANL